MTNTCLNIVWIVFISQSTGPEPEYDKIVSGYKTFSYPHPFYMQLNQGVLPELNIAYETWGDLNEDKNNAVLLHTGLSASSHARSHEVKPDFTYLIFT